MRIKAAVNALDSKTTCRARLDSDIPGLLRTRYFYSGKILNDKNSRIPLNVTRTTLEIDKTPKCMWWIERIFQTCISDADQLLPNSAYVIIVQDGLAEAITWEYLDTEAEGFELTKFSPYEKMIFHFSHWKKKDTSNIVSDKLKIGTRVEMSLLEA
jgi:hypothetical protein